MSSDNIFSLDRIAPKVKTLLDQKFLKSFNLPLPQALYSYIAFAEIITKIKILLDLDNDICLNQLLYELVLLYKRVLIAEKVEDENAEFRIKQCLENIENIQKHTEKSRNDGL